MSDKPLFPQVLQIFIVVDDAEKYTRTYSEVYGIGPWTFANFSDEAVPRKSVRGASKQYQIKLAICTALNVNIALIEPLDDLSIFAAHLKSKGPGLHHLLLTNELGYQTTLDFVSSRGNQVIQNGATSQGIEFAHVDMLKDLGMIVELFKPPGAR
jgi:hypothetical protein